MKCFDHAEKDSRDAGDNFEKLGGALEGITYPQYNDHGNARYPQYSAAVTFMYVFHGILALKSLVTVEGAFRDLDLQSSSGVESPGQVIAVVIASLTAIRAGWLHCILFARQPTTRDRGYHNLFS